MSRKTSNIKTYNIEVTEPVVVPALRFKEFEGDWIKEKLGNKVEIKSGISPSSYKLKETGSVPFFKVEELNNCTKYQEQSRFYSEEGKNLIPSGSIIFPKRGAAILNNKVRITTVDSFMDSNLMALMVNKENNSEFLFYFLLKEQLFKIADTSTIPQINNKHIEPYFCITPSLPEQQKIASFLSAVDKKIQQLTKKKELLEEYKKGVMQKLFSGELRFKDENGKDYPDWEEKRLGDVIEFANGKGHEQNIDEDGDYVVVNSKFISTSGKVRKYCNTQISPLDKGDIVMVMSDVPNGKALAKCFQIDKDNVYTLNQRICRLKEKSCVNEFLIYVLNRNKYYLRFDSGVGQTNLKKDQVLNCPLFIPSSKQEQKRIASFLLNVESKIEYVNNQITQSQTFKKGLLQQMFV